jgi:hypothetical protein
MARIVSGLDISGLLWHSKNAMVKNVVGTGLTLIGTLVVVAGLTLPIWGEMDLSLSGKVYVGLIYAVIGLALAGGGVALVRRRER